MPGFVHFRARVAKGVCLAFVVAMTLELAPALAWADSSLQTTARAVVHDLGALPTGTLLVVVSPLTSDVPAPRGDELVARIGELFASELGPQAHAQARPMARDAARVRGRLVSPKPAAIVYVDLRIENGELRLTADLYPLVANGWDRLRALSMLTPSAAHGFCSTRVAAEVRSYLVPLHLERSTVTHFVHDIGPLVALACGDLDGDGGNDLVLVSQREVAWGYLQDGRFVPVKRVPAASLGSRVPVPLREPFGTAFLVEGDGSRTLYLGWGDRAAVSAGPELIPRTWLNGLPTLLGDSVRCAATNPAHGGFEATRVSCYDGVVLAGQVHPHGIAVDAWIALDIPGVDGQPTRVVGTHEVGGTLHLARVRGVPGAASETLEVSDAGSQVAVADLDQDGMPDVVTTSARPSGEDAVLISSWGARGFTPRFRFSTPSGVDAVAVCPADIGAAPSVVAAAAGEIWVVH